jgi:hypothetical protein
LIRNLRAHSAEVAQARLNEAETAEDFLDQWQRRQKITMLFDEAVELVGHPNIAAKSMLEVMPKTLAPRPHV